MKRLKPYMIAAIKKSYPAGTLVQLISMRDKDAPPGGTKGKVVAVDSWGTIHVDWEDGSALGLIYGEDHFKKVRAK